MIRPIAAAILAAGLATPAAAAPMTLATKPSLVTGIGCDAFTPVDIGGRLFTAYGDASLSGKKQSMGLAELVAGRLRYVPTGDIAAGGLDVPYGGGSTGIKPSSALAVGGRMYVWLRNLNRGTGGSQLTWSDTPTVPGSWQRASWTEAWGYPVFVQGLTDGTAAVMVADTTDAYHAGSTASLYRMSVDAILDRATWQPIGPVLSDPGNMLRFGVTAFPTRGRFYLTEVPGDPGHSGSKHRGLVVWSASALEGPWTPILRVRRSLGEGVTMPPALTPDRPISETLTGAVVTSWRDRFAEFGFVVGAGW